MVSQSLQRSFGILWGTVFLGIGALKNFPAFTTNYVWFLAALSMFICAFVFPSLLKPFCWVWMQIGNILHRVMNPIIMAIFFWGIITPISLIGKISRRDQLRLKFDVSDSYWIKRSAQQPIHFKHQF